MCASGLIKGGVVGTFRLCVHVVPILCGSTYIQRYRYIMAVQVPVWTLAASFGVACWKCHVVQAFGPVAVVVVVEGFDRVRFVYMAAAMHKVVV